MLNALFKKTNFYKNQFVDAEKFSALLPQNLEIVNLGSRHPKFAFDYSGTGVSGMNWAIGPQSFEYDLRILKKFYVFLKRNAFVIVPVCPFNFFLHKYPEDSANYKYYKILDSSQINNYSFWTKLLHIDYPILTAGYNLLRIVKDVPPDRRLEMDHNPMNEHEIGQDAQKWITGWLDQFSLDNLDNITLSEKNRQSIEKNIAILCEIINFCLEENYRPVVMLLPVTKNLRELLPETFINEYILENIKKANTKNVKIINYLDDDRFVAPELYFNSFFLNGNGRKYFTKTVVEELNCL
jgi:hypothetical protein